MRTNKNDNLTSRVLSLWNFSDPKESESNFVSAQHGASPEASDVFLTQIARTWGLRSKFEDARNVLRQLEPRVAGASLQVQAYYWIELGRTLASAAHSPDQMTEDARRSAREAYLKSAAIANEAGLDHLAVDALHMMAITFAEPAEQLVWNERAVDRMTKSTEPEAQKWAGPLHNNLGYALHLAGRYDEAIAQFESSRETYRSAGSDSSVRIADWMIAWTLRVMGKTGEALEIQLRLEKENAAAGEPDVYVFQELEALYALKNDQARAAHYRDLQKPASA